MDKNIKISEEIHKMLAVEARIEDKKIGDFAEELILKGLLEKGIKKIIKDQEKGD
jgi:hypothetical protein